MLTFTWRFEKCSIFKIHLKIFHFWFHLELVVQFYILKSLWCSVILENKQKSQQNIFVNELELSIEITLCGYTLGCCKNSGSKLWMIWHKVNYGEFAVLMLLGWYVNN